MLAKTSLYCKFLNRPVEFWSYPCFVQLSYFENWSHFWEMELCKIDNFGASDSILLSLQTLVKPLKNVVEPPPLKNCKDLTHEIGSQISLPNFWQNLLSLTKVICQQSLKDTQLTWLHIYTNVFKYWKCTKTICGSLKLFIMVAYKLWYTWKHFFVVTLVIRIFG